MKLHFLQTMFYQWGMPQSDTILILMKRKQVYGLHSDNLVLREKARRDGRNVQFTYEVNLERVWEEDEFWIELSWRIDKK